MSIILQAEKLYKEYKTSSGAVNALNGVDLSIEKGLFYAIIGRSGSGKSTLLHVLSGLDRPTSGKVLIDGVDMFSFSDEKMAIFRRRSMGFVFQQFNLLPVLTARENILLPLLLDRRRPDSNRLEELAGPLGIADRLEHLPHELSGGQQQRVAIARALCADPEVLFADEPTGNLDSNSGREVMELLRDVNARLNKTVVVITHDSRVAALACRRLEMCDGTLREVEV